MGTGKKANVNKRSPHIILWAKLGKNNRLSFFLVFYDGCHKLTVFTSDLAVSEDLYVPGFAILDRV